MLKIWIGFLFLFSILHGEEPTALYLTWIDHPEKSITVSWIAEGKRAPEIIQWRRLQSDAWASLTVVPVPLPQNLSYSFYSVNLENLLPETLYEFHLEASEKLYRFKTMPTALTKSIKFVVGGDVYRDDIEPVKKMNRIAAQQNPDFILLGGDLAYSASKFSFLNEDGDRWIDFLKAWSETMVRDDGRLIPVIATVGNHDVNGRYDQTKKEAEFYSLFFPGLYRVIDCGNYLSLWILDSGHLHKVGGRQTEWLKNTLEQREKIPYKFALYHVPAYPSVRPYNNNRSEDVRKFWTPIFEESGLTMAFEHHDHAYKRTFPLLKGKEDNRGVIYVGDGAWGVKPRDPQTKKRPYLYKTAAEQNVVTITLFPHYYSFQAINAEGVVFDDFEKSLP